MKHFRFLRHKIGNSLITLKLIWHIRNTLSYLLHSPRKNIEKVSFLSIRCIKKKNARDRVSAFFLIGILVINIIESHWFAYALSKHFNFTCIGFPTIRRLNWGFHLNIWTLSRRRQFIPFMYVQLNILVSSPLIRISC